MNLISPTYRELNSKLHASNPNYGTSSARWRNAIANLVCRMPKDSTVLDYGCGKGLLAAGLNELGIEVAEYDPAVDGKDALPVPASLVVCTDVLEHIEPECLDNVLKHLRRLTKDMIFFTICTRPAKKFLEDGRNAHINLHEADWWLGTMMRYFEIVEWSPIGAEITGIATPRISQESQTDLIDLLEAASA